MEQKVSIVTGGSRGIGAEICRRLSSLGYNVVLCYNNSEESAKAIAESHDNIFIYKIDVSQADQIKALIDWTYEKFGRIDLLVNNAGIDMFSPIQDYSNEEIDSLLKTNLYSYIWACRDVSKYMIGQKSGNIINISSVFGQTGASCESIYSVSKAGIDGLTKSLAKELGLSGIRVNSIAPGLIDTDMNARLDEDEKQAFIEDEIPLGRIGTPADVANVVEMLEKCDYITGQIINVSGGWDK